MSVSSGHGSGSLVFSSLPQAFLLRLLVGSAWPRLCTQHTSHLCSCVFTEEFVSRCWDGNGLLKHSGRTTRRGRKEDEGWQRREGVMCWFNWFFHLMVFCQLRRYLERVELIHMGQKQLLIFNQSKMFNKLWLCSYQCKLATSLFPKDLEAVPRKKWGGGCC